jgi:hypothetical protein
VWYRSGVTRVGTFVAALIAAASSTLWPLAASAHGGTHDVGGGHPVWASSEAVVRAADIPVDHGDTDARASALASPHSDALVSAIEPSHCPADDNGLPCACGTDRCTNFPQPLPLLAQSRTVDPPLRAFDDPPQTSDPWAVASRSPAGSIGARAPPHFFVVH